MIDKYPYAVILNKFLDPKWTEENLSVHDAIGEDCMGGATAKRTHMYGIISLSGNLRIYFFQEKSDFDKVCELPDVVVDTAPFMTFLPDSLMSKIFRL